MLEDRVHLLFPGRKERRAVDVRIRTDDSLYARLGQLQRQLAAQGKDPMFFGWRIVRKYSRDEIAEARMFSLRISKTFEPEGEFLGTTYDESTACAKCGAGGRQVSDLILPASAMPRGRDIAKTIAGEIVASSRFIKLVVSERLTGLGFRRIIHKRGAKLEISDQFQQVVPCGGEVSVSSQTLFGEDPFQTDRSHRHACPKGDLLGIRLVSQVFTENPLARGMDFCVSSEFVGLRSGVLRPEKLLFASPHAREVLVREKVRGCEFDVVRVSNAKVPQRKTSRESGVRTQ